MRSGGGHRLRFYFSVCHHGKSIRNVLDRKQEPVTDVLFILLLSGSCRVQ